MKEYKEGDKRKRYDGRQKKKEKVKVVDWTNEIEKVSKLQLRNNRKHN